MKMPPVAVTHPPTDAEGWLDFEVGSFGGPQVKMRVMGDGFAVTWTRLGTDDPWLDLSNHDFGPERLAHANARANARANASPTAGEPRFIQYPDVVDSTGATDENGDRTADDLD